MKNDDKKRIGGKTSDANRDPITGAPGSHPVGTGLGAAAGGLAGAGAGAAIGAAAGTVAGPVGTGVGIVAGAIAGAAGGHAIAERVNPTDEEAYWREHHADEPYYRSDYKWEDYQGAYTTGYEGYSRLGSNHSRFEDAEPELQRDYETRCGHSKMRWDSARPAVRAAWDRVSRKGQGRNLETLVGQEVYDVNNNKIGTLKCIWSDERGEPEFVGVNTGWLFGKTHIVPSDSVQVGERSRRMRLPYAEDKIKNAPAYDADAELNESTEREVWSYYGVTRHMGEQRQMQQKARHEPKHQARRSESETAEIPLSEEKLKVGKREVETGGVRLRKIIRTEIVNQPVELKREEIVVERVPASEADQVPKGQAFQEDEIYIPLRREEAVIEKSEQVREVVRTRKSKQSDRQEVSEQVRREDVEIESTGEAQEVREKRGDRTRTPAEELAERERIPRSRRNP